LSSHLVVTLRIETDHADEDLHEDLFTRIRALLEDELVYGSLAQEENPAFGLECSYHLE
jgi:hypothetical protein